MGMMRHRVGRQTVCWLSRGYRGRVAVDFKGASLLARNHGAERVSGRWYFWNAERNLGEDQSIQARAYCEMTKLGWFVMFVGTVDEVQSPLCTGGAVLGTKALCRKSCKSVSVVSSRRLSSRITKPSLPGPGNRLHRGESGGTLIPSCPCSRAHLHLQRATCHT